MRFFIGCVFSVLISAAAAADIPVPCTAALRRSLSSSAAWKMERRLPDSERVLVSTGTVECVTGERIVWKTLHPFPSSVSMSTDSMVFADEDSTRVKPLSDLPHYAEIKRRTDAFVSGDKNAFTGLFELKARMSSEDGWTVVLSPCVRAMRRLFSSVTLTGRGSLDSAVLTTEDGGCSTISFKELPRGR